MNSNTTIKKGYQFKYLFKKGQKTYCPSFGIYVKVKKNNSQSRLGIALKKGIKTSVQRNATKRKLRALVRKYDENINCKYDMVIICGQYISSVKEVEQEYINCLKRLKIWKD